MLSSHRYTINSGFGLFPEQWSGCKPVQVWLHRLFKSEVILTLLLTSLGQLCCSQWMSNFSCSLYTDYACALQKDILLQGRLYLSENWLCFHSNIFRWETTVRFLSSLEFHIFFVLSYQDIGLEFLRSHPVNLILVTLGCEERVWIPEWKCRSFLWNKSSNGSNLNAEVSQLSQSFSVRSLGIMLKLAFYISGWQFAFPYYAMLSYKGM